MGINSIFDNTIQTLQKSLDVRARKHEVTASNIANADTPNYKAVELLVEKELVRNESSYSSGVLAKTHPLHMHASPYSNTSRMGTSEADISEEVTLRGDGNTVNIEKEMAELSENNLMYRASADILSKKLQGIVKAIQSSRR